MSLGPTLRSTLRSTLRASFGFGESTVFEAAKMTALNGSTQFLSAATHASYNPGAGDLAVAVWFEISTDYTPSVTTYFAVDHGVTGGRQWYISASSTDQIRFGVAVTGGSNAVVGSVTQRLMPGGRYFVFATYDHSTKTATIQVNAEDEVSVTNANFDPTAVTPDTLVVGARKAATNDLLFSGHIARLVIAKPTDVSAIKTAMQAYLWNSGRGRSALEISDAQQTAWGITNAWDLHSTGNQTAEIGGRTLTATGSPTVAARGIHYRLISQAVIGSGFTDDWNGHGKFCIMANGDFYVSIMDKTTHTAQGECEIWRSTDQGANWSKRTATGLNATCNDSAVFPWPNGDLGVYQRGDGPIDALYRSTDNGATFSLAAARSADTDGSGTAPAFWTTGTELIAWASSGDVLIFGVKDTTDSGASGILWTRDNGATWHFEGIGDTADGRVNESYPVVTGVDGDGNVSGFSLVRGEDSPDIEVFRCTWTINADDSATTTLGTEITDPVLVTAGALDPDESHGSTFVFAGRWYSNPSSQAQNRPFAVCITEDGGTTWRRFNPRHPSESSFPGREGGYGSGQSYNGLVYFCGYNAPQNTSNDPVDTILWTMAEMPAMRRPVVA